MISCSTSPHNVLPGKTMNGMKSGVITMCKHKDLIRNAAPLNMYTLPSCALHGARHRCIVNELDCSQFGDTK
jgi:hypothetical protein